jgi:hypothetical protein
VVEGGFAVVEHSTLVGAPVSGINGHGNWAVVDLSDQTTEATEALLAGDFESSTFSFAGLVLSRSLACNHSLLTWQKAVTEKFQCISMTDL